MAQGLGTTYHEAGTLWMGDNPPPPSPTPAGRFHHITNAYACDQEHHYAGIDPGEKINPLSAPSTHCQPGPSPVAGQEAESA
jgi:hypothetical protein